MTGDGLFGELLAWTGLSAPPPAGAAATDAAAGGDDPMHPDRRAPGPIVPTPLPFPSRAGRVEPAPAPAPAPAVAPQPFTPPPWPFDEPAGAVAGSRVAGSPQAAGPEPSLAAPLPFASLVGRPEPAPPTLTTPRWPDDPSAASPPAAGPRPSGAAPLPFPSLAGRLEPAADRAPPPVAPPQPFTPPPWPYDPPAASPPPATPQPSIAAPLPFASPPGPTSPPPAAPPAPFSPPPWPFDRPDEPAAAAARPVVASPPFIPTPLPFAPDRVTLVPEPVIVLPKPPRRGPRFGKMHAEATARGARYAAAYAADVRRGGGSRRSDVHVRPTTSGLSARSAAIVSAAAAYGPNPVLAPPPPPASPAAKARADAIERALSRGRALGERDHDPARHPNLEPVPAGSGVAPDRLWLGLALVFVLLLEVVGGVIAFSLTNGYLMLAFGLSLDACARTLGTVAASRPGRGWGPGWPWACALIGSPAVVAFAFYDDGSLVDTDLAPLAGPISAFAIVCIIIGLAGIPAGL